MRGSHLIVWVRNLLLVSILVTVASWTTRSPVFPHRRAFIFTKKRYASVESHLPPHTEAEIPSTYDPMYGPPPDLPSLLLANRVLRLGPPSLMIASLLYLHHSSPDQPVTLYITGGVQYSPQEALSVADTMLITAPPIHTIAMGRVHGPSILLAALGSKGHRIMLPNARLSFSPLHTEFRGQATDISVQIEEAKEVEKTFLSLLAKACDKDFDSIFNECQRRFDLTAHEAVAAGFMDAVAELEKSGQPT